MKWLFDRFSRRADLERRLQEVAATTEAEDYHRAIGLMHETLDAFPNFAEREAIRYVRKFSPADRSRYWNAPTELFADCMDLRSTFETIYARNVWGRGSGEGSDIERNILNIAYIQKLIDHYQVRSIVDLGCGDWRFSQYIDFSGCEYHGFDIVSARVEENRSKHGAPNIRFSVGDATTMDIPACDLILCKDVLQHLTNAKVSVVLEKCKRARLALVTNDYHPANEDVADGSARPLDISKPPFNFPAKPKLLFNRKIGFLAVRE